MSNITFSPEELCLIGDLMCRLGRFIQRTIPSPGLNRSGQFGEVDLIRKYLRPGTGTYVDIGAGDPEECSNTWPFYQEGWRGLLIEPLPSCWYRLMRLRPRDKLVPIAASNATGYARMRVAGYCSSLNPTWDIRETAEMMIETDTLRNILGPYQDIMTACRLCSIDVEGHERQVLEGIDFTTFRPDVFVIEYVAFHDDRPGEDLSHTWAPILFDNNYALVASTRLNKIYQERSLTQSQPPITPVIAKTLLT